MEGYEESLSHPNRDYSDFDKIPESIRRILKHAVKREWRHLAEERLEDVKPEIPLGRNFWKLSSKEKRAVSGLFETNEVCT